MIKAGNVIDSPQGQSKLNKPHVLSEMKPRKPGSCYTSLHDIINGKIKNKKNLHFCFLFLCFCLPHAFSVAMSLRLSRFTEHGRISCGAPLHLAHAFHAPRFFYISFLSIQLSTRQLRIVRQKRDLEVGFVCGYESSPFYLQQNKWI